jgi:hypothetical protein
LYQKEEDEFGVFAMEGGTRGKILGLRKESVQ